MIRTIFARLLAPEAQPMAGKRIIRKLIRVFNMKTIKSFAKRFKATPQGKVMKRKCGQNHLNAKESGKITLNKRRDPSLSKESAKVIRKLINKHS